jgi:hypothetical protein
VFITSYQPINIKSYPGGFNKMIREKHADFFLSPETDKNGVC